MYNLVIYRYWFYKTFVFLYLPIIIIIIIIIITSVVAKVRQKIII